MKRKYLYLLFTSFFLPATLISCTTAKKADLSSQTPQEALNEVSELKDRLYFDQVDLLAPKEFSKGLEKLAEARSEIQNEAEVDEVLEDLAKAKGYFQSAQQKANDRQQIPERILDDRKAAISTGLRQSKELREELADIDSDVRSKSDNFSKTLSNKEFSKLQQKYLDLEGKGVKYRELHRAEMIIETAKSNGAKKKAPGTLELAQRNFTAAANIVEKNSRNADAYEENVNQANRSAKLLDDVMNKIREIGKNTSERAAIELVRQDREIGKLSGNINDLEQNLNRTQSNVEELTGEIETQKSELESASEKIGFQRTMDEMREKFDEDEAEVYQQGKNLVIRLKKMNFSIGSAELPADSMELLSRVNQIVEQLEPEKVTVQGHTDSTGSKDFNQKLSADRAEAVASYFRSFNESLNIDSVGFGDSRPIASNSTKEGRAKNRRVDIVVSTKKYLISFTR